MADPYVPLAEPFWADGAFSVYERSEGRFTAVQINSGRTYRGTLKACADWILRNRAS